MKRLPFVAVAVLLAVPAFAQEKAKKPTKEEWQAVVDKATKFLASKQDDKGGWSSDKNIGVTGVVVTGLLQCGASADAEPAAKGLKFIEGLVNEKAGHIAGADPKVGFRTTSPA